MKKKSVFDTSYLTRTGLYVLTAALAFGVIVYAAYHLLGRFSPGLELVDAVPTSVSRTVSAYGYIMRDETAVYATIFSAAAWLLRCVTVRMFPCTGRSRTFMPTPLPIRKPV